MGTDHTALCFLNGVAATVHTVHRMGSCCCEIKAQGEDRAQTSYTISCICRACCAVLCCDPIQVCPNRFRHTTCRTTFCTDWSTCSKQIYLVRKLAILHPLSSSTGLSAYCLCSCVCTALAGSVCSVHRSPVSDVLVRCRCCAVQVSATFTTFAA